MIKKVLLKILFKLGFKKSALKVFNSIAKNKISLTDIRKILEISQNLNSEKLLDKYAKLAIELYPKNSLGYVVLAEVEVKHENYNKAKALLSKSPNTKDVKSLLKKIKSKSKVSILENETNLKESVEIEKFKSLASGEKSILSQLKKDPFNEKLHLALVDLYLFFNNTKGFKKIINMLSVLPGVNKTVLGIVKKSELYQASGEYQKSLNVLTEAQVQHIGDRRILFKMADIMKYDKQIDRAHIMLQLGELSYPTYGAIRRLSFEVDNLLLEDAHETLERILEYPIKDLSRYMVMINRISAYLPEFSETLIIKRIEVEKELYQDIFESQLKFNKNFKYLISGRYLSKIDSLLESAKKENVKLDEEATEWYAKIKEFIDLDADKSFLGWIDIANKNESEFSLIGLDNGIPIQNIADSKKQVVELFIPNSIFTNPQKDKSSFATVNKVYKEIFHFLIQNNDVIILPRHQYNWRYANPSSGKKILSYHTHSNVDNPNWLHIQESTFAGHVSIDSKGFAGYASIANDFYKIEESVKDISEDELSFNFDSMVNTYVHNNVSKYEQKEEVFESKEEYVFVALQVMTDIVADLAYLNGVELLKQVVKHYEKTDIKVVVKRHPYCNSLSLERIVKELEEEKLIELSSSSIHSLIRGANIVFTVNSGVGLESLMHLKPVVISGESEYSYAVHSLVKTKDELKNILEKNNFKVEKMKILKFLYFYNKFYIQDQNSIAKVLSKWLR